MAEPTITLHYHPLASFCWKVLIALYEKDVAFERVIVDLGDAESRARFAAIAPLVKFPVIEDIARGAVVSETSIIIEHLDLHFPETPPLIPADPLEALPVRARDRFWDLSVQVPMQRIVADRIRADDAHDPTGVAQARADLATACAMAEDKRATGAWRSDGSFDLADCAAFPALYYTDRLMPLAADFPLLAAYLDRLHARPSIARVMAEAAPYLHMFPG